jgi:hypothetical protein
MSFELFYATGADEPQGDHLASNSGWVSFGDWVERLDADQFPLLAHLVEEGWVGDELNALEQELTRALAGKPGRPSAAVLSVGRHLLDLVRDRPEGCEGIVVSDGG